MKFFSNDIPPNSTIPSKFTCDGPDSNPHLAWSNAPSTTQSFAILIDDPDSPSPPNWCHLLLYNIPATIHEIPQNSLLQTRYKFGWNNWNSANYKGPCPPHNSNHKYIFHLYALDQMLPDLDNKNKPWKRDTFLEFIENHRIDVAEFEAFYSRMN
jgi:Raf kinase inhibitor-like YbhB/YbcL family protein